MQSWRPSRSFVSQRKQALDAEDLIGVRRRSGAASRERGRRSGSVSQIGCESGLVVESLRPLFSIASAHLSHYPKSCIKLSMQPGR